MEPKFIELHTADDGQPSSVNVENILMFYPDPDEKGSYISFPFTGLGSYQNVTESYDEIKQLIKDSGILIHRADPRLNTERELTFSKLREMIGEPVWNSNLLHWELVKKADDLYITTCSTGQYDSHYDENDLIKTPLYRMKRD